LKDATARARIRSRLDRVEQGNYGDYKSVGEGVYELRFFFGPGYRIYFGEDGEITVLLLCGGDKTSQRRDIIQAQSFWQDYLTNKRIKE
jgi:putative addiction module killer protein